MSTAALKRRLMGGSAGTRPTRKNELLSKPRIDPGEFAQSLQAATGMSAQAAAAIAASFPRGEGLEHVTLGILESLGATRAQAERVRAAFGFVRLCDQLGSCEVAPGRRRASVETPDDVVGLVGRAIGHQDREYFAVVLLDEQRRVIDIVGIGVGTLSRVEVHPREVFKEAIAANASSIIIAHNHPSSDPRPSNADLELTKRMVDVGAEFGIPVIDHIITTSRGYHVSLADAGEMPGEPPPLPAKRSRSRKKTVRNELLLRPMPDRSDFIKGLRETTGMSAKTASAIAKKFPNGLGLEDATADQLEELGATRDQAETLFATFHLVRMCSPVDGCWGARVESPRNAEQVLRSSAVSGRNQELFVAMLLDTRQRVLDIVGENVGPGTLGLSGVRMSEVFKRAIQASAHSIIAAHYYPGFALANVLPVDHAFVSLLKRTGAKMGIPVLDYIVIAENDTMPVSFVEAGVFDRDTG